ncbi:MAG: helix-turn-helix transcriptional regulator [Roseburia sp.]|nr:helix-turn-helix transcriptional regulator [Roseburia sp.]
MYKKYEELLKRRGITSYQVSKDTGIGQNTLSQWKTGRSNPKLEKLKILANYFGVSIEYFLEDTTEPVQ